MTDVYVLIMPNGEPAEVFRSLTVAHERAEQLGGYTKGYKVWPCPLNEESPERWITR